MITQRVNPRLSAASARLKRVACDCGRVVNENANANANNVPLGFRSAQLRGEGG